MHYKLKKCKHCGSERAERKAPAHILHLLLAIVTGGLWIPIWLLVSFQIGGWYCSNCKRRV